MRRTICIKLPRPGIPQELERSESHHLLSVLRLNIGDRVEAIDGRGGAAVTRLIESEGQIYLEFIEDLAPSDSQSRTESLPIEVVIAILKGDPMQWIVEKSAELGASRLIPLVTDHTVVKIDRKGPQAFQARWQKIADQSLKQCGRLNRLLVEQPRSLDEFLKSSDTHGTTYRIWFDESLAGNHPDASHPTLLGVLNHKDVTIMSRVQLLVGPEGGWSQLERQSIKAIVSPKTYPVSLGPVVLRAETAAICALSVAATIYRNKIHETTASL